MMFKEMFNFGKKRTLKESFGFFVFHSALLLAALTVLRSLGV